MREPDQEWGIEKRDTTVRETHFAMLLYNSFRHFLLLTMLYFSFRPLLAFHYHDGHANFNCKSMLQMRYM